MLGRFVDDVGQLLKTNPRYFWERFVLNKPNPIHAWKDDTSFQGLYQSIKNFTLVDEVRCYILYQLALQSITLDGDIAEIGVYRGGIAKLLAHIFQKTSKTLHLFDTFFGMPPVDPTNDWIKEGSLKGASLEEMKTYLKDFPNAQMYPGIFPVTAKPVEDLRFSLVHVDVDIYKSVQDCCHFFYPRMVKGAVMVFDDYGFLSCPGARRAVDEFFADKPERICYLPTGQIILIKQ